MANNYEYFDDKELDWKKIKWATFSASEAFKLMVPGKDETFSPGGHTYIRRIAREAYTIFNEEGRFSSMAMKMGKIKEPESFQFLYKMLGFNGLQYLGGDEPIFKQLNPDAGCSPDVLAPMPDGKVSFGCELKNPTGDVYFNYLVGEKEQLKTQDDLKFKKPNFYAQIQMSMLCYDCDLWIFGAYNEYFPLKDRMIIIEVKRDKPYLDKLEVRLAMAIKKKNEWIEMLRNRN